MIEEIEGSAMKIEIKYVFERTTDLCAVYWTPFLGHSRVVSKDLNI